MLSLKDIIGYFSPARSPYYLIIAASIFGLMLTGDLDADNATWALVVVLCGIPILLCFILSLFHKRKEEKDDDYNKEMKFARSAGVIGAVLATSTFFGDYVDNKQLLYFIFTISIFQISLFGIYLAVVQIQKEEKEVATNMLQLCLVTTSLFVGICFSTSYEIKMQKNYEDIRQYKALDAELKIIGLKKDSVFKARREKTSIGYSIKSDSIEDNLLAPLERRKSEIENTPLHKRDIPNSDHYNDKYLANFNFRYGAIRYGLVTLWLILIFRWIFHLFILKKAATLGELTSTENDE